MGCAISFLIDYMHFYRSGWPSEGSGSMVFIVRIEYRSRRERCKSCVHTDFCRSDSILVDRPPLPPTLGADWRGPWRGPPGPPLYWSLDLYSSFAGTEFRGRAENGLLGLCGQQAAARLSPLGCGPRPPGDHISDITYHIIYIIHYIVYSIYYIIYIIYYILYIIYYILNIIYYILYITLYYIILYYIILYYIIL